MPRKRAQKYIRSWDSHEQRPNESLHGTVAKAAARELNTFGSKRLRRSVAWEWIDTLLNV
jgi:hypothetical protein